MLRFEVCVSVSTKDASQRRLEVFQVSEGCMTRLGKQAWKPEPSSIQRFCAFGMHIYASVRDRCKTRQLWLQYVIMGGVDRSRKPVSKLIGPANSECMKSDTT